MTVKTHCDSDNCGESRSGEDFVLMNGLGEVTYGWWSVHRGDHVWHFHDIHCLQRWATDEAMKNSLKADLSK